MQIDIDTLREGLVAAIAAVGTFIGYKRWKDRRDQRRREEAEKTEAAREARFISAFAQVHERVTQHDKANREQFVKNHNAILDIYQKHEKTQQLILAAEVRAADRFEKLLAAVVKGHL